MFFKSCEKLFGIGSYFPEITFVYKPFIVVARNGGYCVIISYRTQPKLQISDLWS